ncbi:MAG: TonB-dependent receptor [Bacteroidales bacterium]|nr:TonB-dependent receptor [Bacteroidales bacterium]
MRKLLLILSILLLVFSFAGAQVTTSGVRGTVYDDSNETLPGATVLAVHEPSGTQYGTVANADGHYVIGNMRVGGPYKITVSFIGYTTQIFNEVYLSLGNMADIKVKMPKATAELEEVVVTASRNDVFNTDRTGAASNVSNTVMTAIPNISRGLKDFTKISPFANVRGNGTSFAGTSNRYNLFAIDGVVNNDVFGLTSSGTNGGQTGIEPISLDAIEEFQINIAPYDVRQGGFTGGGINAITKSGTNSFKGSVYYYLNNQNFVGANNPANDEKEDYPEYRDFQAGVTLGGPIVKNKLFFFVNGEITQNKTPLSYVPGTDGSNITIDEVNRVLATLQRIAPGYDPGSYLGIDDETNSTKIMGKLNWNISAKHKLMLRHSYTFGENTDNSRSANALRFYNNGLYFPSKTNSTGLELNSIVGNNMSNRLMIGYTRVRDDRDPLGDPFPSTTIRLSSSKTITVGSEYSSVANQLDQDIYSLTDHLTFYRGKHTFTVGTHNELYSFYNLFVQNIYGNYSFNSLESFESQGTAGAIAPTYYAIGYSFDETDNPKQTKGAADFSALQLGFYAQDEYQFSDRFQVTAGLRVDIPLFLDKPEANAQFNSTYGNEGKTGDVPDPKIMWSPRLGFNWDASGNRSFQVRGGTGLFTGRVPFVWISNQFSNNGQLNGTFSTGSSSASASPITNPPVGYSTDPYNQPTAEELGRTAGRGAINIIDKDLKFPQVFRSNLAIDKKLGWGVVATVEGIFSKTYNNVKFINLNRQEDAAFVFEGPDQRPRYTAASNDPTARGYNSSSRLDPNYDEIVKFENTNKGYSYNIMVQLQKQFDKGFTASMAYNHGRAKDINSGTSSVAYSNWRYVNQKSGLNNLELTTSDYDLGSRFTGYVSYRKEYMKGMLSSQFSLFYNSQTGGPLSYVYSGDLNNDGTSNDMIYIPAAMSDINLIAYNKTVNGETVTVSPEDQWEMLNSFIEGDDYLKEHRGEYAERNGARLPFSHQFDFRFVQEIKLEAGSMANRLQFSVDIINVGNMLNKKWGRQYSGSYSYLIDYKGLEDQDPSSAYQYSNQPTFNYTGNSLINDKPYSISDLASRWRMQLGIRYIFN